MNNDYFRTGRILDGGMGQELLRRGLVSQGTLWSASALLQADLHPLVTAVHRDFINAGADVITTNSFTARKQRLVENNIADRFVEINQAAGALARAAADAADRKVYVAGSLPPQNKTYQATLLPRAQHQQNLYEQANILRPYVDCFYLDVVSSIEECQLVLETIAQWHMPVIVGIHVRDNGTLPSGESLAVCCKAIASAINKERVLGVLAACAAPETVACVFDTLAHCGYPFGFKINAFTAIPENWQLSQDASPVDTLGSRQDLTPQRFAQLVQDFHTKGATILGGCCEITPEHITAIASTTRSL